MKLRIRRSFDTMYLEADSGLGYVLVKSIALPQFPAAVHAAVTSPSSVGAWPVQTKSET